MIPEVATRTRRCLAGDSGSKPLTSFTNVGARWVTCNAVAWFAGVAKAARFTFATPWCSPAQAFSPSTRVSA